MYHASYCPPSYHSAYDKPGYYSPRYSIHTATPSPRSSPDKHQRRATHDYAYATPRRTSTTSYSYADYASPGYTTQQRKPDYVSEPIPSRGKSRRFEDGRGGAKSKRKSGTYQTSRTTFTYPDGDYHAFDSSEEYLPRYEERYPRTTPPPPYTRDSHQRHRDVRADYYSYCDQIPSQTKAEDYATHHTSRPRRASYTAKPQTTTPRPRANTGHSKPPPTPPKATDEDRRKAGIPAGFNLKNWDPTEEPILLLGSVFDANSLGKWIYDWTVAWYGPNTPMSEIAGDLWLLLIQLAGKIKRAESVLPKIRHKDDRELIGDYLDSGERLWQRFNKLLKICESFMLKAASRDSRTGKPLQMGQNSGCEFVDTIFGRDRELERTEKLMAGIRLWSMRFDANCEEVLR
ncbi:hypothetical protein AAFC00_006812 [Neodothiora populina]|uniref:Vegetative cell wall protein gp1 n=1 Tax=Neodothiora populina TaxID=2781224 RepID=A0ABR3PB81_9PEZI